MLGDELVAVARDADAGILGRVTSGGGVACRSLWSDDWITHKFYNADQTQNLLTAAV
jgi:hypothetical protein